MQLAAIDIGTNSVHMIVVRVRPDLSFEVIDSEKAMVRLGAGGLDGRLEESIVVEIVPAPGGHEAVGWMGDERHERMPHRRDVTLEQLVW